MSECPLNYRFKGTTEIFNTLPVFRKNTIIDRLMIVSMGRRAEPSVSSGNRNDRGRWAGKPKRRKGSKNRGPRTIGYLERDRQKKMGNGKGYHGGKGDKDGGKNAWQKDSGKRGDKGQEEGDKGEDRFCWTCGRARRIAARCRKESENNLYILDQKDSEHVEEVNTVL